MDAAKEWLALNHAFDEFDIRARSKHMLAGQLSGGNQQKLLLAKMMLLEPKIVIIDEPTRGVDIGAKSQIYEFVAALAAAGKAVIVISSEMQELIGLCHRVLIMREGRIVGEVAGEAMSEAEDCHSRHRGGYQQTIEQAGGGRMTQVTEFLSPACWRVLTSRPPRLLWR